MWNASPEFVAEVAAQLQAIAEANRVPVLIMDPDWEIIGFDELPLPEDEQQANEAARVDEWLPYDPTPEQVNFDAFAAEVRATRESDYPI